MGEILGLKWSYIDRKAGFIRLPAELTKESKPKRIPINRHVNKVLNNVPRALRHDFVFTYRGNSSSEWGIKRSYTTACKNSGVPYGGKTQNGITFHDIRRTVKTNMLKAGLSKVYRDVILGHSLKGMDVHYLAPDEQTLAEAMEKYTAWIDGQLKFQNVDHSVDQAQISENNAAVDSW